MFRCAGASGGNRVKLLMDGLPHRASPRGWRPTLGPMGLPNRRGSSMVRRLSKGRSYVGGFVVCGSIGVRLRPLRDDFFWRLPVVERANLMGMKTGDRGIARRGKISSRSRMTFRVATPENA